MSVLGRVLPITVAAAVVAAVAAYVVYGQQQQETKQRRARANQDQPAPVLVARASVADVPIYLDAVGNTRALNTVTVRPQVGGQIVKVAFKEGQDVQKGFVLAEIDPRTYQAQYDQAVAKKAQDEATLANARIDLERYTRLAAMNSGSKQQADTQKALVAQLEAQVQGDQAAIDNTRTMLSYQDHLADRRTHRHPHGRRGQSGAGERHPRLRCHHPDQANLGAVQFAATAVPAGEYGVLERRAARRCARRRQQDLNRPGHLAGHRQSDGSDHRDDPHEGGVSQCQSAALARAVHQHPRAGRYA